uniref:Anthranilate synthase component 1 n=1 Tax=Candidatus Kentrum sp. TUN TaxID=2126343 RepID=A0A450ZCL7_9GAMM|nr:MAG: anthranilate synthase component 1 [Candidatus Kentron sp. TUN]VFK51527.1 MAG: anthranilate synthase component 1 [Candidatus Kentron sp. TUN]VFK55994.1 MAG: anthranilate synthase component 1 [Candidatus Kentron sp. TUN]
MTPEQFDALAREGYTRIPLVREIVADLDTPLSTYLKLAGIKCSYLLESLHGGEKWGRYSIIGLPCRDRIKVCGRTVTLEHNGKVVEEIETPDPFAWIASFQKRFRSANLPGLPRFTGGLVGYFGYDAVRYVEPKLGDSPNEDPIGTPDIILMISDEVVIFDNLRGTISIVIHADPSIPNALPSTLARLDELTHRLHQPYKKAYLPRKPQHTQRVQESDFISGFTREGFESAVNRIKEYIVEGDIMQVVLSQRLSIPFEADPLDLYRALRGVNPSPYMYYFDLGEFHIVGSSPEILVHLEEGMITVRPIAGTRPRGETEEEDLALEQDLLSDPKERAEHLMLIDLGRNDVGRVARIGSVQLTEKMVIERYSHVMHIVSNVIGRLKPTFGAVNALKAAFPAGTVTGAPKIRAMEIIDELEPVKRGIYAGTVGYLGWDGNMDTAITIRTAIVQNGMLHIQVGAGIVADSIPEREWEETMNKGRAIFRAVARAESGFVIKD